MRAIRKSAVVVLALAGASHAVAAPREAPGRRLCPEDAPEGVRLPPRAGCAAAPSAGAARVPSDGFRDFDGVRVRIGGRVGVDAGYRR